MELTKLSSGIFGIVMLVLSGCSEKNQITNINDTAVLKMPAVQVDVNAKVLKQARLTEFLVIDNKGTDGGRFIVYNDAKDLFVSFVMAPGWRLDDVNLAVAPNLKAIPINSDDTPDIGKFPLIKHFREGVTEFTFKLPFSQYDLKVGQSVIIAAFSVMHRAVLSSEQQMHAVPFQAEGWAGNFQVSGPNNWSYVDYSIRPDLTLPVKPEARKVLDTAENSRYQ